MILSSCGGPQPEAICLPAIEGTVQITKAAGGYCFLYPKGYEELQQLEEQTVLGVGSLLNFDDPRLHVDLEDAAGRTAADAADAVVTEFGLALPDVQIPRSAIELDDHEAVVLDGVPGQEFTRQVFVVEGERLYRLTFMPADAALGERYERMETLYQTVIDSWRFVPQLRGEPGQGKKSGPEG